MRENPNQLRKADGTLKIVNKNINTYEKEDGLEVVVTYEVLENIGTNEKILAAAAGDFPQADASIFLCVHAPTYSLFKRASLASS